LNAEKQRSKVIAKKGQVRYRTKMKCPKTSRQTIRVRTSKIRLTSGD